MLSNYKIKVNNETESKEAQELFFELGYDWYDKQKTVKLLDEIALTVYDNGYIYQLERGGDFLNHPNQEITLPKLRDLVVLHRNDVDDWNCVDPEFKEAKLYLCSDKALYVFDDVTNIWKVSSKNGVDLVLNRLIMKGDESLNNLISGNPEGLISSADAKLAWAKGEDVQISFNKKDWKDIVSNDRLLQFEQPCGFYRIKPRTIKLEVEIPVPFEPKVGEFAFYLDGSCKDGFDFYQYDGIDLGNPLWRSSKEIKKVVEVLSTLRNSIKGVDNV